MGVINIIRAIIVRLCFACHGLLAILLLTITSHDRRYWLLTSALVGLFVESVVTLCKKRGREWKWFCPSVFFYLLSTVPAIWFLELHALEKRILHSQRRSNTTIIINESTDLTESMKSLGVDLRFRIPKLDYSRWIQIIEQFLLLLLILGRWVLPKGKLTHDQLSQLLLVYIGTAADIVEFFEAFKEDQVKENRLLCRIILSIWSWSLLQFTMVLTATRARKDQSGIITGVKIGRRACCTPDVYGIVISILMQDLPFLILRLVLIFHYGVMSYTNLFFTAKNTLVILLLMYRLVVVQISLYERAKKQLQHHNMRRRESDPGVSSYSELWKLQVPGQCNCKNGIDTGSKRENIDDVKLDFFNYYDKKTKASMSNGRSVWDPVADRAPMNPIPRHDPCTSFTLMLQASKIMNDYQKQRKQQGDIIIARETKTRKKERQLIEDDDDYGISLHLMT